MRKLDSSSSSDRSNSSNQVVFRFHDFEVDLCRQEIRHHGAAVPAQPKVFDLLVYLVENRNRTIDKQELQQAVWMGAKVSDAAVAGCVVKLRRLVGDDPRQQTVVKTIHGNGYRFVAALDGPPEGEELTRISAMAERYQEALKASDRLSVAVLPFLEFGEDPERGYFSAGVSEDLITELSRSSSLFVTSRQTTMHLRASPEDARSLARKLGVAYVVQGSIRRSDFRIRITVHLIDANSNSRIWSETYDRGLEEIPMIHDDVTRTIAATIGGRVEAQRVRQPLDSHRAKAYDSLLLAKWLHDWDSKAENAEARALLEQAIAISPDYALAYSWLASVHACDCWNRWTADPDESMRLALEFSRKALALDDSECVIHRTYGEIADSLCEFKLAGFHYRRAMELNPNDTTVRGFYALLLLRSGQREEAIQHMAVANRLDPFGRGWTPWANGVLMFALGRYLEAIDWLSQLANVDNPTRLLLAAAFSKLGELDQARTILEKFLKTAREEMESLPGKDEGAWMGYVRRELTFEGERDFADCYAALVKAGWRELLSASPALPAPVRDDPQGPDYPAPPLD